MNISEAVQDAVTFVLYVYGLRVLVITFIEYLDWSILVKNKL